MAREKLDVLKIQAWLGQRHVARLETLQEKTGLSASEIVRKLIEGAEVTVPTQLVSRIEPDLEVEQHSTI